MNKCILTLLFVFVGTLTVHAQMLEDRKFHEASNYYVNNDLNNALSTVKEGLRQKPGDQKLEDLRKLLEKEKKKEEEKKEQEKKDQEKQKKDQDKKDQQNKDQDKKDQDKKDQDKKDQEKKDQEKKDQDNKEQNKDQKKDQDKKDQDKKDQEKKDQEKKEQDKKDGKEQDQKEQKDQEDQKDPEKKEVPPEVAKRLEQMKITEDKARMILEAMKNQETQYLQQNKRKATKSKDRTKPDW
jgi:hypothetical protein